MYDDARVSGLLAEGLAHHRAGRLGDARARYEALLALAPEQADGLHLRGLVAHSSGDHAEAIGYLERAVALRPDSALYRTNLGTAHLAAGDLAAAERCFRAALEREPGNDDALTNLGLALLRDGRADAAAPYLAAALDIAPARADAALNLADCRHSQGNAALARGQDDQAEAHYRAALLACPDHAPSLGNLGNLLAARGRFDDAEAALRGALAARPGAADAHHNLAAMLAAAGRLEAAEAACLAALRLDAAHADALYTLGTIRLLAGRLPEGFAGLEWRWRRRGFTDPRRFAQPRWDGDALGRRTLLLYAEQGVGDAIQMLRFVPALAARGRVVLEVPRALRRLAEHLAPAVRVVAAGASLPAFDVQCPLPSLPFALKLRLSSIPADVPYVQPIAADAAMWRGRLASLPGLRVGVAWAGNPAYAADARRSIPPDRLAALADVPGVSFVSLQPGAPPPPGLKLHDDTLLLRDFADTAALIAALDLVVSVDTAVVHLAGALGRPVWLLNRFDSCWRWMLGRTDSPWYPTLRQFRQPSPGDWDAVLTNVREELAIRARAAYWRESRKLAM